MKRLRELMLYGLVFTTPFSAFASHIFGGNFGMKALPQRGFYQINLTLFFDVEGGRFTSEAQKTVDCSIRSVADGRVTESFTMTRQQFEPLVYKNAVCVQEGKLRTSTGYFSKEIFLDPAIYNQPQGYIIVFSTCCRNEAISNIQNPIVAEGVVTLHFPPITQNGAEFRNSSPDFGLPNGDYICSNKPFEFNVAATDTDGDELRYSLVTPYRGADKNNTGALFQEIRWASGISLTNIIPGPQPPVINARTGMMSLIANRAGVYIFTVLVEEYRAGKRIGFVRRDFQLPVVDCQRSTLPEPLVYNPSNPTQPIRELEVCEGTSVTLTTAENSGYAYQWQRNNVNLTGANAASLPIDRPGDYRVIVSSATVCAGDTNSLTVKIKKPTPPVVKLTPADTIRFCDSENADLTVTDSPDYQYKWYRNGEVLVGQEKSVLNVKSTGTYIVQVATQLRPDCIVSGWDTVQAVIVAKPIAKIVANRTTFCPKDSIMLQGSQNAQQIGEWYRNEELLVSASPMLYTKRPGEYRLKVIDGNCSNLSEPVNLSQSTAPIITFDSLSKVCLSETAPILIHATPEGGVFVGKGIDGNNVIVKEIGVGTHLIKYELKDTASGCVGEQTRYLVVLPPPQINLSPIVSVVWGSTVTLNPQTRDPANEQFQWSPAAGLDNPNSATPNASVQQNTTYTLRVTDADGCVNQAATELVLTNLILIPDVFSPNNDGLNDRLEIKKNGDFAALELFIYDRWGELLFYEKDAYQNPWDGMYHGVRVPAGTYAYVVQNQEKRVRQAGSVRVLY